MALPMALIIIAGEIDLSVESMAGLVVRRRRHPVASRRPDPGRDPDRPRHRRARRAAQRRCSSPSFGLPSLVVTLGTLALFRGLALVVLGSQWRRRASRLVHDVRVRDGAGHADPVAAARSSRAGDRPRRRAPCDVARPPAVRRSARTPSAARYSGVRVASDEARAVRLHGAVAALAGVILTARFASARADIGQGLTLTVITIVLLGGVNIFGGRGTIPGVVLAVRDTRRARQRPAADERVGRDPEHRRRRAADRLGRHPQPCSPGQRMRSVVVHRRTRVRRRRPALVGEPVHE